MCRLNMEVMSTYRKEEVGDVVGGVHSESHVCKMEGIGQVDQRNGDDVVRNKLLEILPWLLLREQEHNHLLSPVCRLEQIVCLDLRNVRPMRERLIHAVGIEVPHRRLLHDVETERSEESEVDGRVRLLHEARLLAPRLHAGLYRKRT